VVEGSSLLVSDIARIKESAWNLKMMALMIIRNFGNHSPNDTASHPSRPESSHITILVTTESFNTCEYVKNLILLESDFINWNIHLQNEYFPVRIFDNLKPTYCTSTSILFAITALI